MAGVPFQPILGSEEGASRGEVRMDGKWSRRRESSETTRNGDGRWRFIDSCSREESTEQLGYVEMQWMGDFDLVRCPLNIRMGLMVVTLW